MDIRISGVILAGGASKRFGGITKANIVVDGKPIIHRILSVIDTLFEEKIIVTNKPPEFNEISQCKIIRDLYLDAGPLGGIHAGLKATISEACFVFAGDMPFLDRKIIADQINEFRRNEYDVLIPAIGTLIEPLHAIYRKSILTLLEMYIIEDKGNAVRHFINNLNVGYMQIPDSEANRSAFTNINSPTDLAGTSF